MCFVVFFSGEVGGWLAKFMTVLSFRFYFVEE